MTTHTLPADLQTLLAGATWQAIDVGCSGNQVYRIIHPNTSVCYLKIANTDNQAELQTEKACLTWLQSRLPVPQVYAFAHDQIHSYLLLSEIPGLMACDKTFERDIPTLVNLLAAGLRQIHQVAITDCPFDQRLLHKLELAQRRVATGLVDETDFDEQRQGMNAETLLKQLLANQPRDEDLVFTHGDYCLPNVLLDPQQRRVNGFIDWGRAGIADRYQDLALAARSLIYNVGPGWEPLLWHEYGLTTVEEEKIAFYQLLDEFF